MAGTLRFARPTATDSLPPTWARPAVSLCMNTAPALDSGLENAAYLLLEAPSVSAARRARLGKRIQFMSMKYRIDRRKALGLMGGAVSLVALPGARVSAQTLDKVSYQTNWRAQAEHGGFYLAAVNGIYKKYGIECDVRQ